MSQDLSSGTARDQVVDAADTAADGECSEYLERIVYFLDNELDQADCTQVQLHLDECAPCLRKYDLERTVKAVVARSCSEAAPAGLAERVRMQIRDVQTRLQES